MKIVKINKNWFFSAGSKYGWVKDGYDVRGVGIKMSDIQSNKMIKIEINGEAYLMDCEQAVVFIGKYETVFVAGGSTKIGVISRSVLRQLTHGGELPKEEEVPEVDIQEAEETNE